MWTKKTFDEAMTYGRAKAQEYGKEYRVIEVNGQYVVGKERSVSFYYPDTKGCNIYPIY